jgi:hypothetical protein
MGINVSEAGKKGTSKLGAGAIVVRASNRRPT